MSTYMVGLHACMHPRRWLWGVHLAAVLTPTTTTTTTGCTAPPCMQARRADTTIVALLKELSTGNAAMKDATDGVGTGNVVALTSVVAEMKALRSDVVTEMKALRSDNAKVRHSLH